MLLHKSSPNTWHPLFFYGSSQGEECLPPPEVSWGHVTGLQTSLLGHLKAFVKNLDDPAQRDSSLALIPAYLIYLEAYYHQLSRQVPFVSDTHLSCFLSKDRGAIIMIDISVLYKKTALAALQLNSIHADKLLNSNIYILYILTLFLRTVSSQWRLFKSWSGSHLRFSSHCFLTMLCKV